MTGLRRFATAFAVVFALTFPAGAQGTGSASQAGQGGPEWFVAIDGTPEGPLTAAEVAARNLDPNSLVWREGLDDWTPLSEIPELKAPAEAAGGPPPLPATGPAPIPVIDDTEYFIEADGSSVGPLTREEIEQRIAARSVDGATLIWHDGMSDWMPMSQSDLSGLLSTVSAGTPPPASQALDPATALVGRWEGRIEMPMDGLAFPVSVNVQLDYREGGALSATGQGVLNLQQQGILEPVNLEIAVNGTWAAETVAETRARVTTQGQIVYSLVGLDMPAEEEAFHETSIATFIDRDTIQDEDGFIVNRMQR